ncbi:uncharacterized protein LOC116767172 [Danaus plexippus]|uniref:uncharacterized protein LOC116767172 n=1 Tax=Danaus plexippus TaxID=13037 RepID=UPI002AB173B7|nr:uncharacterized protein LOC116767172 [Danaus plexippus]
MHRSSYVLFCFILILCNISPLLSKRTFGGGRHSYPKSGGLSGVGGSHSYPSGGHGYPSGNSHGYPSSGGLSGNSRGGGYPGGGSQSHPSGGMSHGYPSQSNSHQYPGGKGLSGNSPGYSGAGHTTNVHYHYNYNPPQQIRYTPAHGGPPMSYPVYRHAPPTYVYQYKDSGSKYGTLLAGLALLNLGTLGVSAYAASKSHSNYKPQPGEVCKFGLKKENGDYEETKIDCQLITSFIFQEEAKTQSGGTNTTTITTVTNVTTVNMTNGSESSPAPPTNVKTLYEMLPNGTLVPINITTNETVVNNTSSNDGLASTSSVTITTTNTTTVTNALDVKGKPVDVTPGMKCYVIRHTPSSNMKRSVPCGLLQSYAEQSLKKNSANRNIPALVILSIFVAAISVY